MKTTLALALREWNAVEQSLTLLADMPDQCIADMIWLHAFY